MQAIENELEKSETKHFCWEIRKATSVSELCDLYLKEVKRQIKDSTLEMDRSLIKCYFNPLLGGILVQSLCGRSSTFDAGKESLMFSCSHPNHPIFSKLFLTPSLHPTH